MIGMCGGPRQWYINELENEKKDSRASPITQGVIGM